MQEQETKFRDSLRDVVQVVRTLGPRCRDFQEMEEMLDLAAGEDEGREGNDALLRMLMEIVVPTTAGQTKTTQGRR